MRVRRSKYWATYVPVAAQRQQTAREVEALRKAGKTIAPVHISGRAIATTFWGKAWCKNLESYHDYENRLPRGRSYVRNGAVLDLKISPLEVNALVSGGVIYRVTANIAPVPDKTWKSICMDCSGQIDSLVELLQGRFSKDVMERLCRQQQGLFPKPSEIRFSCSCPDYASMCKHIAAVFYGIGARLDEEPALLFRLRAVDESELVANIGAALPTSGSMPTVGRALETGDVAALFGLDMASLGDGSAENAPEEPGSGSPTGTTERRRSSGKRKASARSALAETPAVKRMADGANTSKKRTVKGQVGGGEASRAGTSRAGSGTSSSVARKKRDAADGADKALARQAVTITPSKTEDLVSKEDRVFKEAKVRKPPASRRLAKGHRSKRKVAPKRCPS